MGTKYLLLFGLEKYYLLYDRIKWYCICFSYNFRKIKIDSDDGLPQKRTLTRVIL